MAVIGSLFVHHEFTIALDFAAEGAGSPLCPTWTRPHVGQPRSLSAQNSPATLSCWEGSGDSGTGDAMGPRVPWTGSQHALHRPTIAELLLTIHPTPENEPSRPKRQIDGALQACQGSRPGHHRITPVTQCPTRPALLLSPKYIL